MKTFTLCRTNRGRLQPLCPRNLVQVVSAIAITLAMSHLLQPHVYATTSDDSTRRPNVVLIMTDDQGSGDLSCLGNEQLRTPGIDRLFADGVRLTNYHVDPTCSPTRSALMTGRYSSRTGVWHTIMGRSLMHPDETTVAEVFAAAGYATGCFGKWHLGDNYPCRPQDQGFTTTFVHGGGGVQQTPDFWGNDYFDDTYWENGHPKKAAGYCTDVFFDAAIKFIESSGDKPFFCYIPTNAAHGPFLVDEKYSRPFHEMGIKSPRAEFYGMIVNIDENVQRMRDKLAALDLADNTIFIFTTDNGTAAGARNGGFNGGLRATKGSEYDGGHRVPFFVCWPDGGITGGRDVGRITAHIDVLPTLAALCEVPLPQGLDLDGTNLAALLQSKDAEADWPARTLVVHSQRIETPKPWRKCAVMTDRWRLINGKELYDMTADRGQKTDLAGRNPAVVESLRAQYEKWYEHIGERFEDYVNIAIGAEAAPVVDLTCHDWHTHDGPVPWNQGHISRDLMHNGYWSVDVVAAGRYEFTLQTRPGEAARSMGASSARVRLGEAEATAEISPADKRARVVVDLPAGPNKLQTWLEGDGKSRGAYFVRVRRVR